MLCERDELPLQFYPSLRRSCKLTGKVARQGVCSACPESTDHRAPVRPSGLVIDLTGQGLHGYEKHEGISYWAKMRRPDQRLSL